MELPLNELLALMIALVTTALTFGMVGGRKPEIGIISFGIGLLLASLAGLIDIFIPITLFMVTMILIGWRYAREGRE